MKDFYVRYFPVFVIFISTLITLPTNAQMAAADQMKLPPARSIPGLTTEDKFPNGCVDCHINMPNINQDERISTLMSKWNKKVGSKLLEKAQAVAPAGVTLKGIHPRVLEFSKNIPGTCIPCHSNTSKNAPPFAALLHSIHLTGGNENHFMTIFQGECTHCHKMDAAKGVWIMPSGSEK
jgi:hypothetical protein